METIPCNRCDFQECEVVRQKSEYGESGYVLIAKCYGCGKYRVLSQSEYAALYDKIDEIPIDDKPDTVEQRAADRKRYYEQKGTPRTRERTRKLGMWIFSGEMTAIVLGLAWATGLAFLTDRIAGKNYFKLTDLISDWLVVILIASLIGIVVGFMGWANNFRVDDERTYLVVAGQVGHLAAPITCIVVSLYLAIRYGWITGLIGAVAAFILAPALGVANGRMYGNLLLRLGLHWRDKGS